MVPTRRRIPVAEDGCAVAARVADLARGTAVDRAARELAGTAAADVDVERTPTVAAPPSPIDPDPLVPAGLDPPPNGSEEAWRAASTMSSGPAPDPDAVAPTGSHGGIVGGVGDPAGPRSSDDDGVAGEVDRRPARSDSPCAVE